MTNKKKIIVIPLGGLGNRMRVLSSCIQVAKRDNRALHIAWPIDSDLGCDITDIFKDIGIEYSVPSKRTRYLLTKIYKLGAIKTFFRIYKFFSKIIFGDSIFDSDVIDSNSINHLKQVRINNDKSIILVATCLAFSDQFNESNFVNYLKNEVNLEYYKLFSFIDLLEKEANKEYEKIGESYIGIHIRRTDHADTIEHSPDQNYLLHIDKCLMDNPKQKFFLATDDVETKIFFKKKYMNAIYSLNSKLDRNGLEGIHAAIIELILLSKSKKIICSVISSYSNTAILLGNIKEVTYADTFLQ